MHNGESPVPKIMTLAKSVDTLLDTSDVAVAIVPQGGVACIWQCQLDCSSRLT